jgi:hypothetical protein
MDGVGALGGLGSFLRTFAGIRDEQSQRAELQRRYEEQKKLEQERYADQQRVQEQQLLTALRTAMGPGFSVDDELRGRFDKAGLGSMVGFQAPQVPTQAGLPAAMGGQDAPAPTPGGFTFTPTARESAELEDQAFQRSERQRAIEQRDRLMKAIATTTDPTLKQKLELALGGINVSTDELTPFDVRDKRARSLAQFEHGLRMKEIGAGQVGRETPEERFLREIDVAEIRELSDIAQNVNLTPDQKTAAMQEIRTHAQSLRDRVKPAQGEDRDLLDIKADFDALKRRSPGADDRAVLRLLAQTAASKMANDPAGLQKYRMDLLRFATSLTQSNASAVR